MLLLFIPASFVKFDTVSFYFPSYPAKLPSPDSLVPGPPVVLPLRAFDADTLAELLCFPRCSFANGSPAYDRQRGRVPLPLIHTYTVILGDVVRCIGDAITGIAGVYRPGSIRGTGQVEMAVLDTSCIGCKK